MRRLIFERALPTYKAHLQSDKDRLCEVICKYLLI